MASTRTAIRQRRGPTVLPPDRPRAAGSLEGLQLEGRALDLRVGERLLGAKLLNTIEGANTLTIDLWDGDRSILRSGILGLSVMTRVAEVTLDGLTYSVAGLSRQGDTLTLACEDAVITLLKRDGLDKPMRVSRDQMTCAQFVAAMIRAAGVPVVVLDEDVVQPIAGQKKLRDELQKAKAGASSKTGDVAGRTKTIGFTASGITIKGKPATKAQRRAISRVLAAAAKRNPKPRALLAAVLAPIGEADYDVGAGEQVFGTHHGLYQSNVIPGSDVEQQVEYFLKGGRSFAAGGAEAAAREHPEWSTGQIVEHVEINPGFAAFYDQYIDEARAIVKASGGLLEQSGGSTAYVKGYTFERKRGESTYKCARRLLDERRWRIFVREGVVVIASEPALARGNPSLLLETGPAGVLVTDDFDWHRAMRVGEAHLQAWIGRYDADQGEVVELPSLPQTVEGQWIIASAEIDILQAAPVDMQVRLPQQPAKEPSSTVAQPASSSSSSTDMAEPGSGDAPNLRGTPKSIIDTYVLPRARKHGIARTVAQNDAANATHGSTAGGQRSDHQGPPEVAWAADMSNGSSPTPEMDALAADLAKAFGISWSGAGIVDSTHDGYRFQLIYRINTPQAGNHFNHVHFGIRRT